MRTVNKSMGPMKRRAFTIQEVAEVCGVAQDSIYRAIYNGRLRPLAGFGRRMISDIELERFLTDTKEGAIR